MRLLFLSHSPNNPDGGASRIYHLLTDGLSARGHDVVTRHLEDFGVPPLTLPKLLVQRFLMPQWLSRNGRRDGPQDFDVVMSSSGMAYPLFKQLGSLSSRPLMVNHIHGLSVYDVLANLTEAHLRHFPVSPAYRAVTGPFAVRWDSAGIAAADVTVVQNLRDLGHVQEMSGSNEAAYIPAAVHPELLAASENIRPMADRPASRILWFGTWESRKGAWYVPRAFRILRSRFPEATLVVGGTGKSREEIAAYFDPDDRSAVEVLSRIPRAEHVRVMNECSIFLFPSLSEGFGLALPEAMAFGLAGVTGATGFGADHVRDGESGLIVPPSSEHMGSALLKLVADGAARQRMASRGRELARKFTTEKMVDEYERLFADSL